MVKVHLGLQKYKILCCKKAYNNVPHCQITIIKKKNPLGYIFTITPTVIKDMNLNAITHMYKYISQCAHVQINAHFILECV